MLGTRLFATVICVYRKFSTKSSGKITNEAQNMYRKRTNAKNRTEWTDQQKQIINAIKGHKSVFITGSAGTGKTFLLKHIIKLLRKQYRPSQVFVTASTGVAACALRGQTIHSFAGIGFQMSDRETLATRVLSDKKACSRLKGAKALVLDEVSLLDGKLFETLEYIARYIREKDSVWGGIQLVVSGDFFQLPPVKSKGSSYYNKEFAFEADCWNSSFDLQVELEKVHRQSDPHFIKFLQGIRKGNFGPEEIEYLQQFHSSTTQDSSVMPVQIYPRNEDVKRVNEERMKSLNNEVFVYLAVDSGIGGGSQRRQLERIVPYELALCLDARVMLTKNLNPWRKLVNGATGTIVGFSKIDGVDKEMDTDEDEDLYTDEDVDTDTDTTDVAMICQDKLLPVVKFDSGTTMVIKPATWVVKDGDKIVAERMQLPLMLAWAVSIHKCQGMTIDCLKTDLSRVFEYGMAYVAISRVRSLEGLHLSGLDPSKIKAHPKVVSFYENLASEKNDNGEDDFAKPKEDSRRSVALHIPHESSTRKTNFHFSVPVSISTQEKSIDQ